MCQWFETFSTENSFNRLSASWRIVSTSQNSAQSRERLAVAPVSKGTESLSTPSKRTCFFFFFGEDPRLCLMTVVSTPAAVGNYPACHEKGNTYPSTLLMRGNKDIFEWPVSLKLSNSNCFFPPQKQETSGQCFPFVF